MEAEAQLGSPRGRGPQGPAPSCRPPSKAADGGVPAWPPGSLLGQQLRNPVLGQWSRQHVSAGDHPQVPGPEEQAVLWDKWAASRCGMEVHAGPARVAYTCGTGHAPEPPCSCWLVTFGLAPSPPQSPTANACGSNTTCHPRVHGAGPHCSRTLCWVLPTSASQWDSHSLLVPPPCPHPGA